MELPLRAGRARDGRRAGDDGVRACGRACAGEREKGARADRGRRRWASHEGGGERRPGARFGMYRHRLVSRYSVRAGAEDGAIPSL